MARPIESQLYRELVESCFSFVERGTKEVNLIYESVHQRFPELCDDEYLCPHRQNNGFHDYEWKHTVRNGLQRCKTICDSVSFSGRRVSWIFS